MRKFQTYVKASQEDEQVQGLANWERAERGIFLATTTTAPPRAPSRYAISLQEEDTDTTNAKRKTSRWATLLAWTRQGWVYLAMTAPPAAPWRSAFPLQEGTRDTQSAAALHASPVGSCGHRRCGSPHYQRDVTLPEEENSATRILSLNSITLVEDPDLIAISVSKKKVIFLFWILNPMAW